MEDSNVILECLNKLPEIEDKASPNYPYGMCKKCLENSLDGSKEKSYTTNTKETQMLNKLKNWIQARRDKKKQAQVDEQAKRYPTNPFVDRSVSSVATDSTPFSSYSTYSTNIGGEETNGNRITSVDDVPEVYTPAERAALSDDSVSSSSNYGGSSYASDSSSSSSSYDSSSSSSYDSGSSSCDSGSSSCSCGD